MSFNCTVDVKLRNFNYKYLMRIIPNNKYLFKCKLAPSVLCDFCSRQCWYIQELWSQVQDILTSNNIEIELSYFNVSFGVSFKNKLKNSVFNFIVLLVRYYTEQKKKRNNYIPLNFEQTRIQSEIIAFSTSA